MRSETTDARITHGEHPDDGTIHAWLDSALDPQTADALATHIDSCPRCAERVAEARGLIAGASRVIGALDDTGPAWGSGRPPSHVRDRAADSTWRRLRLTPTRAAIAATILVAAGVTLTYERTGPDTIKEARARAGSESAAAIAAATLRPLVAPDTSPAMRVATGRDAARAVSESTSAVVDRARTTAPLAAPGAPPVEARIAAAAAARVPDSTAPQPPHQRRNLAEQAPRPLVQTATTIPIPRECYRVESAAGDAAIWGSVEAPFILALDASGGGARVLTIDGTSTSTSATWTKGNADSLLVHLRRTGFQGTLTLGTPSDIRAGVMRSAPIAVARNKMATSAAAGTTVPRSTSVPTTNAAAANAAPTSAPAAPAVPIVAQRTPCPSP